MEKAYTMAWNAVLENRDHFMGKWKEQLEDVDLLKRYRAEKFMEYMDGAEIMEVMDAEIMLKTLDHIKVCENGTLIVVLLDGTELECKNEDG